MYDPTPAPSKAPRGRSRGLSSLSTFSLTHGHYDPSDMGWRDRLWLLGYRADRWLFKGIPYGYPLRAKVKITLQVRVCVGGSGGEAAGRHAYIYV